MFGTPKSGKGREAPLSNDAIRALRTLFTSKRGPLVFSSKTGKPLIHSWTDNALRILLLDEPPPSKSTTSKKLKCTDPSDNGEQ